ncbi:calpain-9-like [Planococcus citri]|uniref:calpain-9-like n=1 Tax=Planococcus citri TaxID=170843 RepID=UPI0031F7692D
MGCHGSHSAEAVAGINSKRNNEPRFSNCNGRITRLIQDDPIDYCTDAKTDKIIRRLSLPIDYETADGAQNSKKYRKWQIHGKWICGLSSGGSRNNIELFATNPQFEIVVGNHTVPYAVKDAVIVSLKQNNFRTNPAFIALFIYKNDTPGNCLLAEYLFCEPPLYTTSPFIKKEMISMKVSLEPGSYVIIPAMFQPHRDNDFSITILVLKDIPTSLHQLKVETESVIYFKI